MKLSINGVIADAGAARIDPRDRGFTLSDGVFETIRVKRANAPKLAAHLSRLRQGLAVLKLPLAVDDMTLAGWMADLVITNLLADAVVRITVSRGVGERGIVPPEPPAPTVVITTSPPPPPPEPARVVIAAGTRRNEHSPTSRIKSLAYLDNVLARQEAIARGADDALMLNTGGAFACASVANVFALIDGELLTPPVTDGALPGIARAAVIALARASERTITREMLDRASEVFLTNVLGVRPVIEVEGAAVGDGEPGLITQMISTRV
jgi:branched-chain amino acid aminotransferase